MFKKLIAPLLLLFAAQSLFAADMTTDTIGEKVVVTATRSEESVDEIPTKVEVIDSQDLDQTVGQTVTEQLKKNASIGVIEYPGALAGIGIRGFRPEYSGITKHSLILVNGRSAGASNLATLLTDNVERIEVLKGPASSLYGAEAMGGVVNIITKKNTDEITGKLEVGLGSFDTITHKAAIGGGLGNGFDFDLTAGHYNQQDDIKLGNGHTRANTSYKTRDASLRLGYAFNDDWRIDLRGNVYEGRDIETPGDLAYEDQQGGHKDIDNTGLELSLNGALSATNTFNITTYMTNETSETYKHYTGYYPSTTQVTPYQSYDSETEWKGVQVKDQIELGNHQLIFGVDYQDIEKTSRSYYQNGSRKAPYSPDESRENIAGYAESVLKFLDEKLTLTAGGRYDTFEVATLKTPYKTDFTPNEENFSTFSPRVGVNYLFDKGVRLHSTVGQAFVPPTAAQLAGYSEKEVSGVTMITKGNADLDPETSLTYDIGVGYSLPTYGLAVDLTYFHTDVDDKITTEQIGNTKTYRNAYGAEMEGIEFMANFDIGAPLAWERTLELYVNATFILKSEEENADGSYSDIHNVADRTINYGIAYDDGLIDGKLQMRYQGNMKDTDWTVAGYPETEYPSFTVVDLMVGATIGEHHRLVGKIDNLLDKDYYEKKGYNKPGRSFFVTYAYQF